MVNQGDIVFIDFNPSLGHEQKNGRPAVVVSNNFFHKKTSGLAILAPITTTVKTGFPLHVNLDQRTNTQGQVTCEQLITIDTTARSMQKIEVIPADLLDRVL